MRDKTLIALIVAIACGAVAAGWVSDVIHLSPDSQIYLAAAQVRQQYGALPITYASFPPLYPLLVSLFPDLLLGAKILNIVSLAFTAFLTIRLLEPDWLTGILIGAVIVLSPAYPLVHAYAWSEPIFIAMIALFFYGIKQKSPIIVAVSAGIACLERYIGVALIPVGLIAVWRMRPRMRLSIPLYLIGSVMPVGIWIIRNVALGQGPMGFRHPPTITWWQAVVFVAGVIGTWLPFMLAAFIVGLRVQLPLQIGLAAGLYCILHCVMIVYSAATTGLDNPDQRLLSPIYLPLLLFVIAASHHWLSSRVSIPWKIAAPHKQQESA